MGRTLGAKNKVVSNPNSHALSEEERLSMIARLLFEMAQEQLCSQQ